MQTFSRRTFSLLLPVAFQGLLYGQAPSWNGVFLSHEKLRALKAKKNTPSFTQLHADAERSLTRVPSVPKTWYVPGYYRDPEGHIKAKDGLAGDANAAYGLALAWQVTGDNRYAAASVALIDAWASGVESMSRKDDSMLSFSYHFPALILAASLLRSYRPWPAARQAAFHEFVRTKALDMNTMDRKNNWGNWGLVLVMASAAYLEDATLFATGVARWKEFIETQIAEDGHLPEEVGRNNGVGEHGIWYTHFCLMPQTIAAEIARVNGIDLYEYRSPSGRTLRSAYERAVPWACDPATFPYYKGADPKGQAGTDYISYWEILNARWPNAQASAMIAKMRPLTAQHTAPYLTFTHGGTNA